MSSPQDLRGLDGVRVLEIAELVAAPYAAKLLADLGAEVIKVESPDGDPSRRRGPFPPDAPGDPEQSGLYLGLNTNKSSVVLDLDNDGDRARLADLVGQADIVIHSLSAGRAAVVGLDADALLESNPSLVITAITPFGHTGPQADWVAEEINIVHGGGWGYLIPGDGEDSALEPLTVFGHPASCQAGLAAALATVAAWDKADRTGVGEFVDMASMAQVSAMLEASFIAWSYMGEIPGRVGGRILTPWKILPCADGLIFLVTVEQDQWERLVDMMGNPEWAQMEVFADFESRSANQDIMYVLLEEWTRQHKVEDLFHEGQARRICFAPVFTMSDLAGQEHLEARGFFHQVEHDASGVRAHLGAPWLATPNLWSLRSGAPVLGQGSQSFTPHVSDDRGEPPAAQVNDAVRQARPLEGVKVIDFTWVWAGPFCTMHLAYLGAEIIKVESSSRPGLGRRLPIHPPELEPTLNTCGYFNQWDQGKLSVEIDLTTPSGIAQALELVSSADVVVDNYATGVMERLGLGDDVLRNANPDLIMASVTGYGHEGPLRDYMGYGPTTSPLSGLTALTGHLGGRPEEAGLSFGDPAAGLMCAYAICGALVHRRRTGEPSRIDTSLWEATAVNGIEAWMAHSLGADLSSPQGNRNLTEAPHGVYPTVGDDEWLSIACTSEDAWRGLAAVIGADANDVRFATAAARKANEDALDEIVRSHTRTHEKWALAEALQAVGVAAYPSLNVAEVEQNQQLGARGFWTRFDHPEVGRRTHSGVPWITRNSSNGVTRRAPLLGEHTAQILDIR